MRFPLWLKFIVLSLVIAWVPLGWLGLRLGRDVDRSLTETSFQLQSGLADRTVDALNNHLDAAVNLLTVLGRNLTPDVPPAAAGRLLSTALNTQPILLDLWVHDAIGRPRHALHRFRKSKPLSSAEWPRVKTIVGRDGVFLGRIQIVPQSSPRLVACVPLLNASSRVQGYLVARLNLYVLAQSLNTLASGAGGNAYLLDGEGRLWAESTEGDTPAFSGSLPAAWTDPRWTQGAYTRPDGRSVLGVKKPLRGVKGWLVFERPAHSALAVAREVRRRVWRSFAFATALGILLALIFALLITRTLRQFMEAIRHWTTGDFGALIPLRSNDELGDFAELLKSAQPVLEKRARDSILGRMARFIGHDLRQLVQALRNALAAILAHVKDPDAQAAKHFLLSYETLDWMDDFIEDILTIGRDRPLTTKDLSLNDVVRRLVPKLRAPEGCRLVTAFADPGPRALLDEKEARKALLNAAKNALEAIGPGGTVSLSTSAEEGTAVVTVSDDGPGFPPEKLEHLFEEVTSKETGSGLGLLVMKKVMDQHGGRIAIDSAPGRGTRVRLIFPSAEGSAGGAGLVGAQDVLPNGEANRVSGGPRAQLLEHRVQTLGQRLLGNLRAAFSKALDRLRGR